MEIIKVPPMIGKLPPEYFTYTEEERYEFNKKAYRSMCIFMGIVTLYFNSRN